MYVAEVGFGVMYEELLGDGFDEAIIVAETRLVYHAQRLGGMK
jgi:hypothetical protein